MPIYNEKVNGYVADAAQITAKRCDGLVFTCDSATATSVNVNGDSLDITGGWGNYPLANIPTTKTMELGFTNAMWDMNLFEFTNRGSIEVASRNIMEHARYAVQTGLKIVIPHKVVPESVYVRGLEYTTGDAETGKYSVTSVDNTATVTFAEGDVAVGDEVMVTFDRIVEETNVMPISSNAQAVIAEITAKFPVYSSGGDCTEAAVKGYWYIHIFKARCTQTPSVDASYKTASTYAVTFTALDPQSASGLIAEHYYVPNAA